MPDIHAMLAPSAAKRWMTCTPSARIEATLPEETSIFAQEGTYAHSVAENLLHFYLERRPAAVYDDPWEHLDEFAGAMPELEEVRTSAEADGFDFREIVETVHDDYVALIWKEYVKALVENRSARLLIEQRVNIGDFVPESFGSSDAIILTRNAMSVFDLKFGRGVKVSAKNNPQIRLYALGALIGPGSVNPPETIRMHIVQPRLRALSSDTISAEDLVRWAVDEVKPRAQLAFAGQGELVPGEHCRFCKAKGICRTLSKFSQTAVSSVRDFRALGAAEIAVILDKIPVIKTWIAGVEAKAMQMLASGETIPGWQISAGRATRKISDPERARQIFLDAGFEPSDFEKTELNGITDLTRLVGGDKAFKNLLGDLIVMKPGNPTLAPVKESVPAAPQLAAVAPAASALQGLGRIM